MTYDESLRGSGRTTRQLNSAIEASKKNTIFYLVGNSAEIKYTEHLLHNLIEQKGADRKVPILIRVYQKGRLDFTRGLNARIFIDHDAVRFVAPEDLDFITVINKSAR